MLSKTVSPTTKAELIRALQAASVRSVEVFEEDAVTRLPAVAQLKRDRAIVVVIR